jgi:hypothetical protein
MKLNSRREEHLIASCLYDKYSNSMDWPCASWIVYSVKVLLLEYVNYDHRPDSPREKRKSERGDTTMTENYLSG